MSMSGNEESDIGHGLEEYDEKLRQVAEHAHVDEDLVSHALAGMVLGGMPDEEVLTSPGDVAFAGWAVQPSSRAARALSQRFAKQWRPTS